MIEAANPDALGKYALGNINDLRAAFDNREVFHDSWLREMAGGPAGYRHHCVILAGRGYTYRSVNETWYPPEINRAWYDFARPLLHLLDNLAA